ncbi:MAG TPA: alpha/beta hydrolase-fold protein [Verrucomicrobiae bacterium]|jgi:phospholipase/carboxylesterase|nr:alpha/beta hydrolase-fold protein [Verrucomicrobiae bacterium]
MQLEHAIFEPSGEGPHPTILALHGWGANALDLLGLAPYLCGGRFLVICPQGPLTVPIGQHAVGYGWFPLTMGQPPDVPAIVSARDKLRAFLDAAINRYPIDGKKLVVLGFSQGGVMAHSLALAEPERFAGVAVLSSWLPKELLSLFSQADGKQLPPILVQHGSLDELIEIARARDSIEALRGLSSQVTYREYDMAHEIGPKSLGDLTEWLQEKVLSPVILAR